MSNRQERNRRKAIRRRDTIIRRIVAIEGFESSLSTADYGRVLSLSLQRESDGARGGVQVVADRLWRRMDDVPNRMARKLAHWFAMQAKSGEAP